MGEDYEKLSKEELIEKLKGKDRQIVEMDNRFAEIKCDYEKIRQEKNDLLFENMTTKQNKEECERLKETIVAMATYTYPGIANLDKTMKQISADLRILNKRR